MKKLTIIFIVFILGCAPEPPLITFPSAVYIGDSNCELFNVFYLSAAEQAGIPIDCKIGRALLDLPDYLPAGYETIFLALGTNDAGTDRNIYGAKLETLLMSTNATVYCVLPVVADFYPQPDSRDPYREEMLNRCENTIDPKEAPVLFQVPDGIHYTQESQALHAAQLRAVL